MAGPNQGTSGTPASGGQSGGTSTTGASSGADTGQQAGQGQQQSGQQQDSGGISGEMERVLRFDPFGPESQEGQQQDGQQQGGQQQNQQSQQADQQPGQQQPQPGQQQPGQQQPGEQQAGPDAALARSIADQANAIRQLINSQQQGGQQQQRQQGQDQPAAPKFNLGLPPQIIDALRSDDPKDTATAMHAVVNGVANAVWNEVNSFVQEQVSTLVQGFPGLIQRHMDMVKKQDDIQKDFYGTYKMFDAPAFKPLVQNLGMLVGQEWAAAGRAIEWGPQMRDEIANRLFEMFPGMKSQQQASGGQQQGQGGQQQQAGQQQPGQQQQQPGQQNNGTWRGGNRGAPAGDQSNEFKELLF